MIMVALLGEVSGVTFNGKSNGGRGSPRQDLTPGCCGQFAAWREYIFLVICRRWWWLEFCLNLLGMVKAAKGRIQKQASRCILLSEKPQIETHRGLFRDGL